MCSIPLLSLFKFIPRSFRLFIPSSVGHFLLLWRSGVLVQVYSVFLCFLTLIFLNNSWLWSFSSSFLVLLSVDSPQHFFLYSLLCGQRVSNAIPLYLMSFFPMRDKSFILARIWIRNPSFSLIVWFWVYGNKAHIVVLNK